MSTDNLEIRSEADYQNVLATLSRRDRPHAILRFLMRALESYRAARKMGWSRPWNKYGVVNFQSFKLDPAQDHELLALGGPCSTPNARRCPPRRAPSSTICSRAATR